MPYETEIDVLIKGPEGPEGPPGEQGEPGVPGPSGRTILSGTTPPTDDDGANGDYYIDYEHGMLYGPKAVGVWPDGISLVGPTGRGILSGDVDPLNSQGNQGDFYINRITHYIFGPKQVDGTWPTGTSLVGPQGGPGEQGEQGITGNVGPADYNAITSGETVLSRLQGKDSVQLPSGSIRFSFFTARKTETITNVKVGCITPGGVPTMTRLGIWSVNASTGDLTLVASSPNDVSLLRAAQVRHTFTLSTPLSKVAGDRYALGIIVVTANTLPAVTGWAGLDATQFDLDPRVAAILTGQTDLPASVLAGSLGVTANIPQFWLVP